jgi:hypothetical protein
VLAVRLWLDRKVQLRTASNVVAGFDEGVGGTLFQLDDLQVGCRSVHMCRTCSVCQKRCGRALWNPTTWHGVASVSAP